MCILVTHLLLEHLDTLSQSRSTGLLAIVDLGLDVFDLVFGPVVPQSTRSSANYQASLNAKHSPFEIALPFQVERTKLTFCFWYFGWLWFGSLELY